MLKKLAVFMLVLASVFLFSTGVAMAEGTDADTIEIGLSAIVKAEHLNRYKLEFNAPSTGVYIIESSSYEVDPYVTLLDSNGNEIAYDDDSGEGDNFRLKYKLLEGETYYYEISVYVTDVNEEVEISVFSGTTVEVNSIDSMHVDFERMLENISGSIDIEDPLGDFFRYDLAVSSISIMFKDGTELSGSVEEIEEITGLGFTFTDPQSYENQWSLGEHKVDVALGSYAVHAYAYVEENTFRSISIPDAKVYLNTNGKTVTAQDGTKWFRYKTEYRGSDIVVETADGKFIGDIYDIYAQTGFEIVFEDKQSVTDQWGVGTHTVEYSFMGYKGSYEIEIAESPVEKVEIEKLYLIEGHDGFIIDDGDGEYFYYFADSPKKVTVTMKDGTKLSGSQREIEMYLNSYFLFDTVQSAGDFWTVGEYTVKYSFMGYQGQYDVEVIENPISSISVSNLNLHYMCDGTYGIVEGKKAFIYDSYPGEITVTFNDGSVVSGSARGIEKLTGYDIIIEDGQENEAWTIGRYTCTLRFMGAQETFYVTVSESPVNSIVVEDITLYEGIDSIITAEGKTAYSLKPQNLAVFYRDGRVVAGTADEIEKLTGCVMDYQIAENISTGKRVATASFMGVSTMFYATVKADPVEKIEVAAMPLRTEFYLGEVADISGLELDVYYKDGTSERVKAEFNPGDPDSATVYLEKYGKNVGISGEFICDGRTCLELTVAGYTVEIPMTEKDSDFESVILSKDENGFAQLTFVRSDETQVNASVLSFTGEEPSKLGIGHSSYGYLVTDAGIFGVTVRKEAKGISIHFAKNENYCGPETNVCDGISFAETKMSMKAMLIYNYYNSIDAFSGLISPDNIDRLLSYAAAHCEDGKPKAIYEDYSIFDAVEIQKCVKAFFAIENIDISCSKNYDPVTNTVRVENLVRNSGEDYDFENVIVYPTQYSYENGYFKSVYTFTNGKTMEVAADSLGRIISYKIPDPESHKHIAAMIPATQPTYLKTGLTEGAKCESCGEVLAAQKVVAKLTLGKTEKITAAQNTKAIKISWQPVEGATGYEVYYKKATGWKICATTTDTSVLFENLGSGKKFTFAVKAYVIESKQVVKSATYTVFETSTKAAVPAKVTSKQSTSAIQLQWSACSGATGYRIYYKSGNVWKIAVNATTKTSHTFKGLKAGAKYTFAIRPYVKTNDGVVWSDYVTFKAATSPAVPSVKAVSPQSGKITLSYGSVKGAEAYQVYYKVGNGSYKFYKAYSSTGTINFSSLSRGTKYTFVVRAAIKTSGGWIFGSYKPVTVTVK